MLILPHKTDELKEMDNHGREILNNLRETFIQNQKNLYVSDYMQWQSVCPVGIEIEVKWRYYFPQLWDKYLQHTSYKSLAPELQQALSDECTELEKVLYPRLEKTRECGIEKGQDKYYEFAFNPVSDMYLLADQVLLLQKENLIPSGIHSLHLTIGNLKPVKDSYYLLLLLEMLYCDKDRVASAFHQENSKLSGTWARKGMGGIFTKEAHELKYGYEQAIELRTLQITDNTPISKLLCQCSILADTIYQKMNGAENIQVQQWNNWLVEVQNILQQMNLTNSNWKKPNLSPQYWYAYMDAFAQLQEKIIPLSQDLLVFAF